MFGSKCSADPPPARRTPCPLHIAIVRGLYTRRGGVRAAVQQRMTLAAPRMPSIRSWLPVPRVRAAVTRAGDPTDPVRKTMRAVLLQVEWYAGALRQARADGVRS
jgi:hypothetical protein